jgi:chromosome segregation ATPase
MKQADLIKAINEKDPSLKVSKDLLVVQLKAIYDGIKAQEELADTKEALSQARNELNAKADMVDDLEAKISELTQERDALSESYQELAQANKEAETSTIGGKTIHKVKVGKETYRTTGRMISIRKNGDAQLIPAAELVKNKKLCEKLVEQGSGFLVKVEPSNEAQ